MLKNLRAFQDVSHVWLQCSTKPTGHFRISQYHDKRLPIWSLIMTLKIPKCPVGFVRHFEKIIEHPDMPWGFYNRFARAKGTPKSKGKVKIVGLRREWVQLRFDCFNYFLNFTWFLLYFLLAGLWSERPCELPAGLWSERPGAHFRAGRVGKNNTK